MISRVVHVVARAAERAETQLLRSPARRTLAAALTFGLLAFATVRPLWAEPGWPEGHEGTIFGLRTQVYLRHLSWGDVAPIWSSADAAGFGTPFPLLYHKLFYLMAAPIALATGSMQGALVATVLVLLVAGAAGTYRLVRALDGSRFAAIVAGCAVITANYTVTDWLIRGALAELSGAMVLPWVLAAFVRSLRRGRMTAGFGFGTAMLWLGHSTLAYFTVLLLALSYLLLAMRGRAPWSVLDPRTAWRAALVGIAIVGPYAAAMGIVAPHYELTRILEYPYTPEHQFRRLDWYFLYRGWTWGADWEGFTTVLDYPLLAALAGAMLARRRWRPTSPHGIPLSWVMLPAALALLLQLHVSLPFYRLVPGADFIQFPWRLLALITPALAAAAAVLLHRSLPAEYARLALGAVAAWMVLACGAFAPIQYGRLPIDTALEGRTFSAFREYEPRDAPDLTTLPTRIADAWQTAGCKVTPRNRTTDEVSTAVYSIVCAQEATVPLPLYASPLHVVFSERDRTPRPCVEVADIPAVCGIAVPGGDSTVSVELPRLGAVVSWVMRRVGTSRAPVVRDR